jgi:hypothetical protein
MNVGRLDTNTDVLHVRRGEFAALTIESILAGAGVMALVVVGGTRFPNGSIPDYMWMGLGFLAVGVAIIPIHRVYVRSRYGRELSILRSVIGALVGAAVGAGLYVLLR